MRLVFLMALWLVAPPAWTWEHLRSVDGAAEDVAWLAAHVSLEDLRRARALLP